MEELVADLKGRYCIDPDRAFLWGGGQQFGLIELMKQNWRERAVIRMRYFFGIVGNQYRIS
jgi:hypothetical protein